MHLVRCAGPCTALPSQLSGPRVGGSSRGAHSAAATPPPLLPPACQVIYDSYNKSVVIEWAGEDGKTTAYDNSDIGALANNPM